jgi:NhaP-type Na+/H+ or K+/H+ antiporter
VLTVEHHYFWYLAIVPMLGIAAQWLAWRLRLPSILILLTFGVLLGQYSSPDRLLNELVAGHSSDASALTSQLLFPFVSLSVAVILFEGGLSLRLHELKTAGRGVFRLVTIGALVTWLLTSLSACWLFDFEPGMAALLGAVLVVTGPTVVAPLLRQIRPVRKVASLVKWEGIVIDPIGAVLAVVVFEGLLPLDGNAGLGEMVAPLLRTAAVGVLIGAGTGLLLVHLVMRYWIPDFLHGVFFLTVALTVFAASNTLQEESGLVTVTVLGIFLANQRMISIHHIVEFKEHLGIFLISCLFIVLGSRLDPWSLVDLGWQGVIFVLVLIIVIRPVSVFAATLFTKLTFAERLFLAFLAPRGIVAAAVASVLALKIATVAGSGTPFGDQAEQLMPITFSVIVGTVAFYGIFAAPLAKRLGLSDTNPQGILFAGADPSVCEIAKSLHEEGIQVLLVDTNYTHVAAAKMHGLAAECISILQEHVREQVDLGGIGRLLAMTANDEVNSMAVREYTHDFGRANVYQLTPWDDQAGQRSSIAEHLRGRLLFDKELHYDELVDRMQRGAQIKKTRLTDEYSFEDFRERYGDSAGVLFVLDKAKALKIQTTTDPLSPLSGDLLVALIDAEDSLS